MSKRSCLWLGAALLVALPALGEPVADRVDQVLRRAQGAISTSFARSLPVPSASAGVSYSFDPVTANFRRDPSTFGQIYLERADPLGAGRINLSFAYQYAELDSIEGKPADNLRDPLPIPLDGLLGALSIPSLRVNAAVHGFLFAVSYGLTEDLDASIAVPVLYSDLRIRADISGAAVTDDDQLLTFQEGFDDSHHPLGIGDLSLRAKYRLLEMEELHLAGGLLLRIPTGTQDDLQGTGYVEVAPHLVASTRLFEPAEWAGLQGHINAALGLNADDVDSSEARWGVGVDWRLTEEITTAVAFLGRHPFARIGPVGATIIPRCNTDLVTCASDPNVRNYEAPLFGLTGDRADSFAASVGGRGGLWHDTLFGFANVVFPLNDGTVRTQPIPMIGIEATL